MGTPSIVYTVTRNNVWLYPVLIWNNYRSYEHIHMGIFAQQFFYIAHVSGSKTVKVTRMRMDKTFKLQSCKSPLLAHFPVQSGIIRAVGATGTNTATVKIEMRDIVGSRWTKENTASFCRFGTKLMHKLIKGRSTDFYSYHYYYVYKEDGLYKFTGCTRRTSFPRSAC